MLEFKYSDLKDKITFMEIHSINGEKYNSLVDALYIFCKGQESKFSNKIYHLKLSKDTKRQTDFYPEDYEGYEEIDYLEDFKNQMMEIKKTEGEISKKHIKSYIDCLLPNFEADVAENYRSEKRSNSAKGNGGSTKKNNLQESPPVEYTKKNNNWIHYFVFLGLFLVGVSPYWFIFFVKKTDAVQEVNLEAFAESVSKNIKFPVSNEGVADAVKVKLEEKLAEIKPNQNSDSGKIFSDFSNYVNMSITPLTTELKNIKNEINSILRALKNPEVKKPNESFSVPKSEVDICFLITDSFLINQDLYTRLLHFVQNHQNNPKLLALNCIAFTTGQEKLIPSKSNVPESEITSTGKFPFSEPVNLENRLAKIHGENFKNATSNRRIIIVCEFSPNLKNELSKILINDNTICDFLFVSIPGQNLVSKDYGETRKIIEDKTKGKGLIFYHELEDFGGDSSSKLIRVLELSVFARIPGN